VWALVGLLALGVSIPLFLAAAAGAIGIPSNDDWVYMRAAESLFGTGVVDMPGHTASAIGQIGLVQPFLWLSNGEPWAFTAFGLTMASIAIASTYLLARRFLGIASAVFTILLLLAFPGFVRESATFMTDVPAYALATLCLLLGARSIQGGAWRVTLIASLAIGVLAVSIREFAAAAPIAVLVTAWARSRTQDRLWLGPVTVALVAGFALVVFASRTSGQGGISSPQVAQLNDLGPAFATLAIVLLPAMLLYMGRHIAHFSGAQIALGAGIGCLVLFQPAGPLLGNLWVPDGMAGNQLLAGTRQPVIGEIIWGLTEQLAIFAAILATAMVVRWGQRNLVGGRPVSSGASLFVRTLRGPDGLLALFLVGYAAELILYGIVGGLFDRYLYPMVPVAAILILRRAPNPLGTDRSHALAHGAFAWLVISAFVLTANSFAYDAARYREGNEAVAMGYGATTVDAGYEWIGSHGSGAEGAFNPTGVRWWEAIWPSFRACTILSNSPLEIPAYTLIRENQAAYQQYLFFGPAQPLFLYGAAMEGCPAPVPE
jgi:4-amino-4-deoxy-L-arabinose transferase-like glycosyltransferase